LSYYFPSFPFYFSFPEFVLNEMAATLDPAVLSRLRMETRVQHEAIEQTLMLMDDTLSLDAYRHRLEQLYGFYKPLEDQILKAGGPLDEWLAPQPRRKVPLLEADLEALGQQAEAQLALGSQLPALSGVPDFFGCLYVLEGATLGGVLITRHVRKKLGVTPLTGGRFFNGYGEQTGAMWQEFRRAITAFSATTDQQDAIVAAARATFETLQHWCER
jgi:heme oxygenase